MSVHDYYEIDEKTGYYTPKGNSRVKNAFTAEQKVEFLKILRSSANFGRACDAVGVNRDTVKDHMKWDDKFGIEKKKVVENICDDMEEALVNLAHRNPTAAFGVLKAYRPSIWKDSYQEKGPNKDQRLKELFNAMNEDKDNGKETPNK